MPNTDKTDKFITGLYGLGMFLVVFGHSSGTSSSVVRLGDPSLGYLKYFSLVKDIIYSFHMPLFFFISGYCYDRFSLRRPQPAGAFLSNKAFRLLMPYLSITLLSLPIKAALSSLAERPITLMPDAILRAIFYPWESPIVFFWFLPTLMTIFCIVRIGVGDGGSRYAVRLVAAGLASLVLWFVGHSPEFKALTHEYPDFFDFMNVKQVPTYLVFFVSGQAASLFQRENRVRYYLLFIIFLCIALFAQAFISESPVAGGMPLVKAAGGIAACWFLCMLIGEMPVLQVIGQHSYVIYLYHWFPSVFLRIALAQVLGVPGALVLVAQLVGGLALPILLDRSAQRCVPRRYREIVGLS